MYILYCHIEKALQSCLVSEAQDHTTTLQYMILQDSRTQQRGLLMAKIYYSEKIQSKISKRKGHEG